MHRFTATSLFCLIVTASPVVSANDSNATVVGTAKTVPARVVDGKPLLDVVKAADAFGWTWKIVTPGKLGTFCRDTGCVPLNLKTTPSTTIDNRLYLSAEAVGKALGFQATVKNGATLLRPTATKPNDDLPAYNAAWGRGRGFRVGQTLPDIPLTDLDGREVRFSQFLGKKYIIYCWASW